jgi:hypothetical protein
MRHACRELDARQAGTRHGVCRLERSRAVGPKSSTPEKIDVDRTIAEQIPLAAGN